MWAKKLIKNKKCFLAKSIENNKIQICERGSLSKWKQFMSRAANKQVHNDLINWIAELQIQFKINDLINNWNKLYDSYKLITGRIQKEKGDANLKKQKENNQYFEFKRQLKQVLTEHQRGLFKKKYLIILIENNIV